MRIWPVLLAILTAVPAGEPAGDAQLILGRWRVVVLMDSGENVPIRNEFPVVISADRLSLNDRNYPLDIGYRLDPTRNPKMFDVLAQPIGFPGIYELNGDTLRICYNERAKGERPRTFGSTREGPSDVLLILKRER